MLSSFRLKAVPDFYWVTETGEMGIRKFVHLNGLLRITTVIPYQQLWPATKSLAEETSTLRDT